MITFIIIHGTSGTFICIISTVITMSTHLTTSLLINCLLNVTDCRIQRKRNKVPQALRQLALSTERLTDVAWSKTKKHQNKN